MAQAWMEVQVPSRVETITVLLINVWSRRNEHVAIKKKATTVAAAELFATA